MTRYTETPSIGFSQRQPGRQPRAALRHLLIVACGVLLAQISAITAAYLTVQQPAVITAASLCKKSVTRVGELSQVQPCERELIFEDNFNTLDTKNWRIQQRFSGKPDYEFNMYLHRNDTVYVANGELSLDVALLGNEFKASELLFGPSCTGEQSTDECEYPEHLSTLFTPPIACGQITTVRSFSFTYGRVDIRAQLPYAQWVFPQLFLQPVGHAYGLNEFASGQMRVGWATPGEDLRGGVLLSSRDPWRSHGLCEISDNDSMWKSGYHLYTLDWRPDAITISIDNIEYCRIDPHTIRRSGAPSANKWNKFSTSPMAPFDRPFFLTLGLGVAGFNDFSDRPDKYRTTKPWQNEAVHAKQEFWNGVSQLSGWPGRNSRMLVDYVRVYAL